jgi:RNA binding exosome subunit
MKFCHNITARVFAKPEEDNAAILRTLHSLFPFDLTAEKIKLTTQQATGVDDSRIILIHEVILDKDRHITDFVNNLASHLNDEQKALLLRQDNRLDEHCNFFLRLDKPKLLEGVYWITDHGNCYHIRLCLAAYPKKKETCKELLWRMFPLSSSA